MFIIFLQTKTSLCFPSCLFLPLLSEVQERELSYGFWFYLFSFSALKFLLFSRLCYFCISILSFSSGENKSVTFFVFKVFCFFFWHQIAEGIKCNIFSLSVPPSLTNTHHTAHIHQYCAAADWYPSMPPHQWPWHCTVIIHEPFPALLLSSLVCILQFELSSGSVCDLLSATTVFTFNN